MTKEEMWKLYEEKLREEEERRTAEGMGLSLEEYRTILTWKFLEFNYLTEKREKKNTKTIKEKILWWLKGGLKVKPFLVLHGKMGTGKTMVAKKLVVLLSRHFSAYFVDVKDMYLCFYEFDKLAEHIEFFCDVGVLAIDDVGTGYSTDYRFAHFFQVMNYRYRYYKPTVITTNMNLLETKGDETKLKGEEKDMVLFVDRLREVGHFVEFDYPSLRDPEMMKMALTKGFVVRHQKEKMEIL